MALTIEERLRNSQEDCRLLRRDLAEVETKLENEQRSYCRLDEELEEVRYDYDRDTSKLYYAKRRLAEQAKKYAKAKVEIRNLRRKGNG